MHKYITIPRWIQFQDNELSLGFNSACDAEVFLRQQVLGNQIEWQKLWKFERIYQADDTIQWILSTKERVVLHFSTIEDLIEKKEKS